MTAVQQGFIPGVLTPLEWRAGAGTARGRVSLNVLGDRRETSTKFA